MSEKSIRAIKEEIKGTPIENLEAKLILYKEDERKGVQDFIKVQERRWMRYQEEKRRVEELCRYEKEYAEFSYICGIDEVGRGPLAGPVVAGAVILPKDSRILYINDSKKLSAKKREELYEVIKKEAVAVGYGMSSPERIDEINILQATYEAMRKAIASLPVEPSLLLNDAVAIPGVSIPQVPIIKGDAKSISIGAASIMAKVTRDRMMVEYDSIYPGYDFASNKGYGSRAHMEALRKMGPTPIHRRSFLTSVFSEQTL
ncbi:MAG: ribonuclease HII [Eubacteriales bacterium]|nr:ribonuclease HII [Eubacteriales bacterium]